jgi:hypothetical protein
MKHNGIDGERPREQRSLDWEELVNLFKGTGQWNSALGPSPGQAGCLAPAHILRAYRCMDSSMEPTKPGAPDFEQPPVRTNRGDEAISTVKEADNAGATSINVEPMPVAEQPEQDDPKPEREQQLQEPTPPPPNEPAVEPEADGKLDTAVPRRTAQAARANIATDTSMSEVAEPTSTLSTVLSTVLTPPFITLQATDAWARQVLGDPELPASACKVAWCIVLHLNRKNGAAFPSIPTIADEIVMSERTVIRMVNKLEARGHLRRNSGGGKTSNRYRLLVKTPPLTRCHP